MTHIQINITISWILPNRERLEDNVEFSVIADPSQLQPKTTAEPNAPQPSTSSSSSSSAKPTDDSVPIEIDDDLNVVYHNGVENDGVKESSRKRSMSGQPGPSSDSKKPRLSTDANDVIVLWEKRWVGTTVDYKKYVTISFNSYSVTETVHDSVKASYNKRFLFLYSYHV